MMSNMSCSMVGLDGDRRIPTQLPKDIDNRTYQFKRNDNTPLTRVLFVPQA